ncbi:MAG TPA: hypothetical protein VK696_04245 [Steroidobacteraceae bacterium]|nr:hypothetical protein [Steroidobacteraceae bacterium]
MQAVDFAKAAGIAAAVLILDILLAIGVVFAWSILVAPGHDRAFYATAGIPIALLSTRIMGTALIFAACGWSARRNPQRNALLFALIVVIFYALLDAASIAFRDFFTLGFAITIALKLLAGIAGALVGKRFVPRS